MPQNRQWMPFHEITSDFIDNQKVERDALYFGVVVSLVIDDIGGISVFDPGKV